MTIDQVKQEIIDLLVGNIAGMSARDIHYHAHKIMDNAGFSIKRNYYVKNRGDGYGGYIDFFVEKYGIKLAIELDNRTKRKKSIYKCMHSDADGWIIFLRDPKPGQSGYVAL